jgi:hypothetical protein
MATKRAPGAGGSEQDESSGDQAAGPRGMERGFVDPAEPGRERRFRPQADAATGDGDASAEPEAVRFLELAEDRVRGLQQAAASAIEELEGELAAALERAPDPDGPEAVELRKFAELLTAHGRALAEWSKELDRLLEGEAERAVDGQPSQGVALLVSQMSLGGASNESIVEVLSELGVEDPPAAVERALAGFS